jgi:hypothetical protein
MKGNRKVLVVASILFAGLLTASVFALNAVDRIRGQEATLEEIMYLPSGKMLKRFSLGYSSLLADIYWTRAVQYFGTKHIKHSMRYDLLYPLLDITTDLDPNLIVAYQSGSIFLAQQPPDGAGQPERAVSLLQKGIRQNPTHWRLYFTLGFVHYLDRHDYKAAQKAFATGADVPGALPWMRVMAARMAEDADNINTAMALWQAVYETSLDKTVRDTAQKHLASLRVDSDLMQLDELVKEYKMRTGAFPTSWAEMGRAGLLRGLPVDPTGLPYKLGTNGKVEVENPARFAYLGQGRP